MADDTDTEEQKPSFDAVMDSGMNAVFDQIEAREKAPEREAGASPVVADVPASSPAGGPSRAPDGKFTKAAPETAAPKIPDQAQPVTPGTASPSTDAPQAWSAEAKALWATLPPDAQKYIAQREGEVHGKITSAGEKLKALDELERVIGPRRGPLAASFGSVPNAINALLELSDFADRDFPGFVQYLARQRGIDLNSLIPTASPQGPVDPQFAALHSEVANLKNALAQEEQARTQAEMADVEATISDFAKTHPHLEAVRPYMASLLKAGTAKGLDDAYEQATWAHPEIRNSLLAEQQATKAKAADDEARKRAAEASRHRAINVTTRGNGVSPAPAKSWDESMNEAFDRVNSAA